MRIIVAGGRTATPVQVRCSIEQCPWAAFASAVVSGGAKGADSLGEAWARQTGRKVVRVEANWERYGRAAGPMRNELMAKQAEGLIATWDSKSRGTASMIGLARKYGLRGFVLLTTGEPPLHFEPTGASEELWAEAEERAAFIQYMSEVTATEAEREAGLQTLNAYLFSMQYRVST